MGLEKFCRLLVRLMVPTETTPPIARTHPPCLFRGALMAHLLANNGYK